tara:strand:- start:296 stop:667 length:372 start_codon:yes stop_codon:yes gene_type:complete
MGFKLGSERRNYDGKKKNNFNMDDASVPGTPVIRKDLAPGIDGEANADGSIFIGSHIKPGSEQERKVLMHEMQHIVDMRTGKLAYDDNSVTWMGEKYRRYKGMIQYNDDWLPEGSKEFPWEKH